MERNADLINHLSTFIYETHPLSNYFFNDNALTNWQDLQLFIKLIRVTSVLNTKKKRKAMASLTVDIQN